MEQNLNILFRCDGSVKIGMGHIVRCLALADNLKKKYNCNIFFAMRTSNLGIDKVKKHYNIFESNEKNFDYKNWLYECIKKINASIFIMDVRDGFSRLDLKEIKYKTNVKIVTIDDPEDKRLESDIAFYPPTPQLKNIKWEGFNGKLYIGWEYVILRSEFIKKNNKTIDSFPSILVSMGATDENNMTKYILNMLNDIKEKFNVRILLGNGYNYNKELVNFLDNVNYEYIIFSNPKNISKVMSNSDFAIISFGQTAYELASLHVPALYLCISKDHYESSMLFHKENIGFSLGIFQKLNKNYLIKNVRKFLNNKEKVLIMSDNAKKISISNLNLISSLIKETDNV
tara:strand:+ start:667 stop:1695 length:1029 start_codon:yes stop_codon:yes gene_type:complete